MNYHYILLPIPFAFEAIADPWLISKDKKDVQWYVRVFLIAAVSIDKIQWYEVTFNFGYTALAIVPFMFFDYYLNWKRNIRWDYLSITNGKFWDSALVKINPVALLVGRIILAAGLIVYWYNVTFGR